MIVKAKAVDIATLPDLSFLINPCQGFKPVDETNPTLSTWIYFGRNRPRNPKTGRWQFRSYHQQGNPAPSCYCCHCCSSFLRAPPPLRVSWIGVGWVLDARELGEAWGGLGTPGEAWGRPGVQGPILAVAFCRSQASNRATGPSLPNLGASAAQNPKRL